MPYSYNEEHYRQLRLRHLIWPDAYGAISEFIIAVIALALFNLSWLSRQLLTQNAGSVDPLGLWSHMLSKALDGLSRHTGAQQLVLFALWAAAGVLIYLLAFRCFQLFVGAKHSIGQGVGYVRQDHSQGLVRWLGSLHDFFMRALIALLAGGTLLVAVVICFGIASQELNNGLVSSFPSSIGPLLISLAAVLLSVRLTAISLILLSARFRSWYLY